MRIITSLIAALLVLGSCNGNYNKADFSVIIPLPSSVDSIDGGSFKLKDGMSIGYASDAALADNAELLAGYIEATTGLKLTVKEGEGDIFLSVNVTPGQNPDGYTLTVKESGVIIDGNSPAGNFYGCQTLRKALPVQKQGAVEIPAVQVKDEPVFAYRGAHLDCSRHFFPAEFVKKYIDILALHNINNFHWHLTDDQGWRIEIKSLPELAEKGSMRKKTMIKKQWGTYDNIPHTGYYTQEEAKEIVAYAAKRHINVIPEIDMPGHMVAALHVYPELGCTGGPYDIWPAWGVATDVLCAGNPKTLELIKQVLGEIVEVFPSHYIHIGGDECPRDRWKECPKCQAFAKQMGFNGPLREARLQNYIMSEAEKFLNGKGREIIGWDEILEGEVSPTATIMSWRGSDGGIQAARAGHKVIMTPNDYCYFDHYQSPDQEENNDKEPFGNCCYLPLEKVYELTPCPEELSEEEGKYILGPQCNIWSEYIHTTNHVEYMLLPRLAALSESGWTKKKDFADFERRLSSLINLYDAYGYCYRPRNEEAQAKMVEKINAEYEPYFKEAEAKKSQE
ncbi:MAG: beta-N-acetylhexosaminidase [Bacteroidaceae bacterium]|nr:beta-N-acetylhexosaminidase [Bacteroidaceae bacterium]